MSDALTTYRLLEESLLRLRWIHQGRESVEEDTLLDKMDVVWLQLSVVERAQLSSEPHNSLLREGPPATRTILDEDIWLHGDLPPRRKEVASCI